MNKDKNEPMFVTKEMLEWRFNEGVAFEETRTVRASGDTTWENELPEGTPKSDYTDYGSDWQKNPAKPKARYRVYENTQHTVKVRMDLENDTVQRLCQYAFSELWVKAQAKLRANDLKKGDDEFAKQIKASGGIIEFKTVSDFEPKSRAMSDADKAMGAINKLTDDDDLAAIEAFLAKKKAEIKAKRGVVK